MADHPILFSGPMIRALLSGQKTQTRRVLKPQPQGDVIHYGCIRDEGAFWTDQSFASHRLRIWAGDRLWVRETLRANSNDQGARWYGYAADGADVWPLTVWHKVRDSIPSIHMPRWASRLTLAVTDIKIERLQDISEPDAIAEGIEGSEIDGWRCYLPEPKNQDAWQCPRESFRTLWDSINAKRAGGAYAWAANP